MTSSTTHKTLKIQSKSEPRAEVRFTSPSLRGGSGTTQSTCGRHRIRKVVVRTHCELARMASVLLCLSWTISSLSAPSCGSPKPAGATNRLLDDGWRPGSVTRISRYAKCMACLGDRPACVIHGFNGRRRSEADIAPFPRFVSEKNKAPMRLRQQAKKLHKMPT